MNQGSWVWGLSLVASTLVLHVTGIVLMTLVGVRMRSRLEKRHLGLRHAIPAVIGVIGLAGLLLAILHAIEVAIWAVVYVQLGASGSLADAMLYSMDSIATRGASGVILQESWRALGAVEAADGMLLFGISTAYIFALMQVYWPMLSPSRSD
jgi:hypothetical protein